MQAHDKMRVYLGKTPIDRISSRDAASWALARINGGLRTKVFPVNAEKVVMGSRSRELQAVLDGFDLALADGAWPAAAASVLYGTPFPHTDTSSFVRDFLDESKDNHLRLFLLGGHADVVRRAAAKLADMHGHVTVAGYRDGYFHPGDEAEVVDHINGSGADVLLLGTPSPLKELFVERNWERLSVPMSVGVGGLFDIWAGNVKEAPRWVRKSGFEWFFRLCQEPGRLWKRYAVTNSAFVGIVLRQGFGMMSHRVQEYMHQESRRIT